MDICRGCIALLITISIGNIGSGTDARLPTTYSQPVQRLFKQAQASDSRPITIHTVPENPRDLQGHTNNKPDRIEITVVAGVSRDYDDALLGHELFHVILNSKGFSPDGTRSLNPLHPRSPDWQQMNNALSRISTSLISCFSDELIGRELEKRGLKPRLQLEKEIDWTKKATLEHRLGEGDSWPTIIKDGQALSLFCLAKRTSAKSMRDIEKTIRPVVGSDCLDREAKLITIFHGQRCEMNDPKTCYKLTLQLRNAAGFKGVIYLRNPETHMLE